MNLLLRAVVTCLVLASITFAGTNNASCQAPSITSITGHDDHRGVEGGRWQGQPSNAPPRASNRYLDRLVTDSFNYASIGETNPYYWDINGSNFGSTRGTVSIGPLPTPFSQVSIVSWSSNKVRIKVVAYNGYTSSGFTLTLRTAPTSQYPNGRSASFSDSAVGIIKSRGCGQCTWFVAKTRIENNLPVPPSSVREQAF